MVRQFDRTEKILFAIRFPPVLLLPSLYLFTPVLSFAVQEPDEQARNMVELVFSKFDEVGSAYGVFRYPADNQLKLGFRTHKGKNKSDIRYHPSENSFTLMRSSDLPTTAILLVMRFGKRPSPVGHHRLRDSPFRVLSDTNRRFRLRFQA